MRCSSLDDNTVVAALATRLHFLQYSVLQKACLDDHKWDNFVDTMPVLRVNQGSPADAVAVADSWLTWSANSALNSVLLLQ